MEIKVLGPGCMKCNKLYFLDADGGLVEMLQGELTEGQIAAVLRRP